MKKAFVSLLVLLLMGCIFIPEPDFGMNQEKYSGIGKGIRHFETTQYQAALDELLPEARKGNMDAQYLVGMIYMYGLVGDKDSYAAQKWLTLAAQNGQTAAQEQLAFLYADPYQPLYNPVISYHWFSAVVAEKPQYSDETREMQRTLYSNGRLSEARRLKTPKKPFYTGVDYNTLFPPR